MRILRFMPIRRNLLSQSSSWLSFVICNDVTSMDSLLVALHLFIDDTVDAFVVVYYSRSAYFVFAFIALADLRRCPAFLTFRNLFVNKVALCFVVFLVVVLEVQLVVRQARHFSTACDITIHFHLFCFSLLSLLSSNLSDCLQLTYCISLMERSTYLKLLSLNQQIMYLIYNDRYIRARLNQRPDVNKDLSRWELYNLPRIYLNN